MHYLFRPYIVYRSRDDLAAPGAAPTHRGWAPVGTRDRSRRRLRSRGRFVTSTARRHTTLQTGQSKNLVLALLGFTITFWAWNIIGPLGVRYSPSSGLSPTQKSLLVAMPVLVGSLGRIPSAH